MSERDLSDTYAKRRRATKAEMEARYAALSAIVAEQKPMTVRQVFYQATVRGLIPKTERERISASGHGVGRHAARRTDAV
jgi:hypothetical protein